jgi:hypothetical protein
LGRRRQPRTEIGLRVQLWGTDAQGHPFLEAVCTENLSDTGAHLKGICMPLRPGDVVGLKYNGRDALFRVVWVGEEGSPYASHAGVKSANAGASLWQVNLAPAGCDSYTPPLAGDRRQCARFKCFISALVRTRDSQLPLWGQVTDISQGGCYVQMPQPLPVNSKVKLELLMKVANLRGDGVVCSSHAGRGMGIKFVEMSNEYRDQLRQFVKWFAGVEPVSTSSAAKDQSSEPAHARGDS